MEIEQSTVEEKERRENQVRSTHEHELEVKEERKGDDGKAAVVLLCKACAKPISSSASPYYYCCQQCDFSLHKTCGELPLKITHPAHPIHDLKFAKTRLDLEWDNSNCHSCGQKWHGSTYHCLDCHFNIDFQCALAVTLPTTIAFADYEHHELTLVAQPAMFNCNACQATHDDKGFSYLCKGCHFWVHQDCASVPNTIKTDYHIHPLNLSINSYSLMVTFNDTNCDMCSEDMSTDHLPYLCRRCTFKVHANCATSKTRVANMSNPDFEYDVIHPIHLPVQDESTHFVSQFFKNKISLEENPNAMEIKHFSHEHPLTLFNDIEEQVRVSSSGLKNEEKDVLCQACTWPISAATTPFYSCTKCQYSIHKCCAKLPSEIRHPFHPDHPLVLANDGSTAFNVMFRCDACESYCNGFVYHCASCTFHLDVLCSSLPYTLIHETHEHPLHCKWFFYTTCDACEEVGGGLYFGCVACGFKLHIRCASLPRTVRHRLDPHPLSLSYCVSSIDCSEEYICYACEMDVNPNKWFYYCSECDFPLHPKCICRMDIDSNIIVANKISVRKHPHSLTVNRHINDVPECDHCGVPCSSLAFRCRLCSFNIHRACALELHSKELRGC